MPAILHIDPEVPPRIVEARFWGLMLVFLVVAVGGTALCVHLTAGPHLAAQGLATVAEQARREARTLSEEIARERRFLGFLAEHEQLMALVAGQSDGAGATRAVLADLHFPDRLDWIGVFDASGEELAQHDVRGHSRPHFSTVTLRDRARALAEGGDGAALSVAYLPEAGRGRFLLAAPVVGQPGASGAVLAQYHVARDETAPQPFVRSMMVLEDADVSAMSADFLETAFVEPVANTDLTVVVVPDMAAIAASGRGTLARTSVAVTTVLSLTLGILGLLGRTIVVAPHHRLAAQRRELAELAAVAQRTQEAISVMDLEGRIKWINPAYEAMSGYSFEEVRGLVAGEYLVGPDTSPEARAKLAAARRERRSGKVEVLFYHKSGRPYWAEVSVTPLFNKAGECFGFTGIAWDVTDRRRQQDALLAAHREIEEQALHDPLTGLPNRRALDLALAARAEIPDMLATIVRIDLDHFKVVNDTVGHAAGDYVLTEVARILREETKVNDVPVRVGGDEFVLLLGPSSSSDDARVLSERIMKRISNPMRFNNRTIRIGACLGVASTGDGLLPVKELTVGADAALYEAKEMGRGRVRLYSPELHRSVQERRSMARELRNAIATEQFVPYFQPQFDALTYEFVGLETLVRWKSPDLGLLGPYRFLPLARQLNLLDEIDSQLFRKALAEVDGLREAGVGIEKVSFNVTAERIQDPMFFEAIQSEMRDGLQISLEILESVFVEEQSDLFSFSLDRLREIGMSIEIDDFGSGHASIVGLMNLRPDVIKVDKRLVDAVTESETSQGIVRQIIGIAELMNNKVTAEGVETFEQAAILAGLGVHTLQGFAFARPMPPEDLATFDFSLARQNLPRNTARAKKSA